MRLAMFRPLNAYGYSKQLFDQYAARSGLLSHICRAEIFQCLWTKRST